MQYFRWSHACGLGIGQIRLKLETADISRVTGCVFTRMFRAQLRKRGIRRVKVLYSREKPEQKYGKEYRTGQYFLCDRDCRDVVGSSCGERSSGNRQNQAEKKIKN